MEKGGLENINGLHDYVIAHSLSEATILSQLREETGKDEMAIMQIPPEQGQFMAFLAKLIGAKRTIEIGVFTGYSTLCLALAMPEDSYTVACDVSEEWTAIGQKYWKQAGVDQKIDLRIAPAIETLKSLIDEGQSGTFDFVFIDADKPNYDRYFELSLGLLRPNGLMAIDNVLLFGSVVDSNFMDESLRSNLGEDSIQAIRDLNIKLKNDARVDISMLSMADGITLVRKK